VSVIIVVVYMAVYIFYFHSREFRLSAQPKQF
jgi:hypothetical protein